MFKKKLVAIVSSLLIISALNTPLYGQLPFKKVVLWGHKLHSHTHSYIHYAFVKAFKHLGYETLWLDKNDNINGIDFSNSLFITEGQVDQNIPLRDDCRYILHNCNLEKYQHLFDLDNCICLQVYAHKFLSHPVEKVEDFIYYSPSEKTIYMPWATDLLPYEIDAIKSSLSWPLSRKRVVHFVGSMQNGGPRDPFDFTPEYAPFIQACRDNNVSYFNHESVSAEENMRLVQESYEAPALQGHWQRDAGYIPCRIFKNISYGQPGITNSKTVYELFKGKIVFNQNTYQLFYDAQQAIQNMTQEDFFWQMDFVRDHHTYLNRIEHLITFLNIIKPLQ